MSYIHSVILNKKGEYEVQLSKERLPNTVLVLPEHLHFKPITVQEEPYLEEIENELGEIEQVERTRLIAVLDEAKEAEVLAEREQVRQADVAQETTQGAAKDAALNISRANNVNEIKAAVQGLIDYLGLK